MASTAEFSDSLPASLLRNRNFLLLWSAYAVSAMGDHLSEMAILKSQKAIDPSVDVTSLMARMTFMFFLPFFLLAPVTGALADWLPRRGLMITADLIRCIIMFGFASLIAWTKGWETWGLFLPLSFVGIFAAVFSPARSALLPTLIRPTQLNAANGMIGGMGIIATMAANVLGGFLARHYDPRVSFQIDAGTFLASALLLAWLRPPRRARLEPKTRTVQSALQGILDAYRYVRGHRRVVELLSIAALVWFCGPLVLSVLPAVVRDVYQGDYSTIGQYRALFGLGFVIGAITVTLLGNTLRSEIAITLGLLGVALGIGILASSAFLGFSTQVLAWIGAIGVVVAGTFAIGVMASVNALLQRTVSNRFRGRVFGVHDLCSVAALLAATGALGLPRDTRVDQWVGHILGGVAMATCVAGMITLKTRLQRGVLSPWLTLGEHLNDFLTKLLWRFERIGPSTVPRQGAVIIAANHTSAPDPLFLTAAAPYRVTSFMIAEEFARWPIIRFFVRVAECIPVTRAGQDTAAFKKAARHLEAGKALGIFIEGKIVRPGETPKPRDGVAMLARLTGAKVIPAHISGTQYRPTVIRGLLARHRARVRFGPAVDLSDLFSDRSDRDAIRAATQRIYAAIQALAPAPQSAAATAEPGGDGQVAKAPDLSPSPRTTATRESVLPP